MISRAGFNHRQCLNQLRRRTGEGEQLRVACPMQQRPLGVNDREVDAVNTFCYVSADIRGQWCLKASCCEITPY